MRRQGRFPASASVRVCDSVRRRSLIGSANSDGYSSPFEIHIPIAFSTPQGVLLVILFLVEFEQIRETIETGAEEIISVSLSLHDSYHQPIQNDKDAVFVQNESPILRHPFKIS